MNVNSDYWDRFRRSPECCGFNGWQRSIWLGLDLLQMRTHLDEGLAGPLWSTAFVLLVQVKRLCLFSLDTVGFQTVINNCSAWHPAACKRWSDVWWTWKTGQYSGGIVVIMSWFSHLSCCCIFSWSFLNFFGRQKKTLYFAMIWKRFTERNVL